MRAPVAFALLALLVSGCATYTWSRPDTAPDAVARQQAECSTLARGAAEDMTFSALPRFYGVATPWPYAGWGAWGNPSWGPVGDPMWRMEAEQRLIDRCMRDHGFELRRIPKS
jgi:hypothetical protein